MTRTSTCCRRGSRKTAGRSATPRRSGRGSPQGTLLEDAGGLVYRVVPSPSRSAKRAALKRAAEELVALGVTSIDDIETSEETLALLRDLEEKNELPIRVRVGLPLAGDME